MVAPVISIPQGDDQLEILSGVSIPSELAPRVTYRIVSTAGAGAMFISYYAVRCAPEGECPVVVKVLRPSFVRQFGPTASLVVKKEAVALGRLNERVPPTPFVVRLIDTGTLQVEQGGLRFELPWIAIEYVHGGAQGTTLAERVNGSMESTGYAFDPVRAARAVECLTSGVTAVHEVGVIHRDVTANSVLCCGSGEDEVFKISDFGLARPSGLKGTLVGTLVGTLGTAPPEILANEATSIGPWSDVFSLAAVIYFLLTGEPYFPETSKGNALMAALSPARRSILEARGLHPTLRSQEHACRSIDFVLGWSTAGRAEDRLQEAAALAAMLLPHLRVAPVLALPAHGEEDIGPKTIRRSVADFLGDEPVPIELRRALGITSMSSPRVKLPDAAGEGGASSGREDMEPQTVRRPSSAPETWNWTTLHHPGSVGVIRSVAWDGYGRCLAATTDGLLFWNGTSWAAATAEGLKHPAGIRFVRRIGPGRWLVGGDNSTLAIYTTGGVSGVLQVPGEPRCFVSLSGDLDDLAVLVSTAESGPPAIHAFVAKRWLRPFMLDGVSLLSSLARVEDERWMITGRSVDGGGLVGIYSPLDWNMERLLTPNVRAFLASAGQPETGVGLAGGSEGAVVWRTGQRVFSETIDPSYDLSAAALGTDGRAWVAGGGRIWLQRGQGATSPAPSFWDCVWAEDSWLGPIVSLFTDLGVVVAMTADGGIVEGRPE